MLASPDLSHVPAPVQAPGSALSSRFSPSFNSEFIAGEEDHQETASKVVSGVKQDPSIFLTRALLFSTSITGIALIAFYAYSIIYASETSNFTQAFDNSVALLSIQVQSGFLSQATAGITLAAMYSSYANSTGGGTFPYVTLPFFETLNQNLLAGRSSGGNGARAISFNPVIDTSIANRRAKFATYANSSSILWKLDQGAESIRSKNPDVNPSATTCSPCSSSVCTWGVNRDIFSRTKEGCATYASSTDTDSKYPAYLVPVWQISPISSNVRAVMYNLHSEVVRQTALDALFESQSSQVTGLIRLVQDPLTAIRPSSIIFAPVFSSLGSASATDKAVAGTTSVVFSWDDIFTNTVSDSIVVVLSSTCDPSGPKAATCGSLAQTWTFLLQGATVITMGSGDLHDVAYKGFARSLSLSLGSSVGYTLTMFPTAAMEKNYRSNRPVVFCVVSIFIILASFLAYFLYDFVVQRQRRKLLHVATRTTRLVDSLFPSSIQQAVFRRLEAEDQLREEQEEEEGRGSPQNGGDELDDSNHDSSSVKSVTVAKNEEKATSKMRHFFELVQRKRSDPNKYRVNVEHKYQSEPIVSYFESTTLFFTDIVGFTSWCDKRQPSEVFHLLETIFDSFDVVARRRGIFKVETVGDCYVAASGLPEFQPDHAYQVSCFAVEIMAVFELAKFTLAGILGEDVYGLRLRVGLNSGGITAGVLRGERGRLQLFGDTINTASRMESTSLPGRIQASQATYSHLCDLGYGDWGQPREELVEAKGKGMLQTYWISPPDAVRVTMQTKALGKRHKHLVSTLLKGSPTKEKMEQSPPSSALSPIRSLMTRMSSSLLSTTSSGDGSSSVHSHTTPLSSFYRARPSPLPGSALDDHAVERVFKDLDDLALASSESPKAQAAPSSL